jgi:hypothetical protein
LRPDPTQVCMIRNALAKIVSTGFTPAVRHVQRTVDHSQVRIPPNPAAGIGDRGCRVGTYPAGSGLVLPPLGTTFSGWEA